MNILIPFLVVTTSIAYVCSDRYVVRVYRGMKWRYLFTENHCVLPNGQTGTCTTITDCDHFYNTYEGHSHDEMIRSLEYCNFEKTYKICCAKSRTRPDNECVKTGAGVRSCVHWRDCPLFKEVTDYKTKYLPMEFLIHLRRNKCGDSRKHVCCDVSTASLNLATSMPKASTDRAVSSPGVCTSSAHPPDQSTSCCGLSERDTNRIIGGKEAGIMQYPWMALIEYKGLGAYEAYEYLLCGGVLISGKYVLTAAHCVQGRILESAKPVSVRLGEYDTENDGKDCVAVDGDGFVCNPGAVKVPIEKITVHPAYTHKIPLILNDIAIIRLTEMINYTDSIRPICLPPKNLIQTFNENTRLFTAGWGTTGKKSSSSTLLHVDVPYISPNKCKRVYKETIGKGHVCAGGEEGRDSCLGDSGGPLMYDNGNHYYLVGLVSYGINCSMRNVPSVYTNIEYYLPWILRQIEE